MKVDMTGSLVLESSCYESYILVQTGKVKANLVTFYFWIICLAQESQDKREYMQYGDFACSIVCTR